MKLNPDLGKRAVMYSASLNWVDTPVLGVQRRMLERDGGEMANRATSVVRYAPGAQFSEHSHDLGEEFIVLDGVFSDESGDYPQGAYVRNPPGSRHRPFTLEGCVIFVKLRQFSADDSNAVHVDTKTAAWLPTAIEGQWVKPLYRRDGGDPEYVSLVKWSPDAQIEHHDHPGGEEIFVLEGSFGDELGRYPKGTWLRKPPGSASSAYTCEGCILYVKTGHLQAQSIGEEGT
ncbi:MAG: cupin domain-containing protein [Porticoccaceae bacterium]|nr:cupin domain-containing protein [Porticoccaceae bacterium]